MFCKVLLLCWFELLTLVSCCSYIYGPVLDETCLFACQDVSTSVWLWKDKSHSIVLDSVYPVLKFLRTLMPQHTALVTTRQNKSIVKLCLGVNWQNIPQPLHLRESPKTLSSHVSNVVPPCQTSTPPNISLYHILSNVVPSTLPPHYLTLAFCPSLTAAVFFTFNLNLLFFFYFFFLW